jgi:acyl dehydratase
MSDWVLVDQAMIDRFAEATLDPDPMHVDPQWCAKNSPFGETIAFGFLTLSLLTYLAQNIFKYEREDRQGGQKIPINYGFNKLRLISPVPVNSRLRLLIHSTHSNVKYPGQTLDISKVEVQIEGKEKPALVGEWLTMWVEPGGGFSELKT